MQDKSVKYHTNTLCLFLENRLGALERVIGTFTMRGHKIENLICAQSENPGLFDIRVSLKCSDRDLEKMVKTLYNQIHVLQVNLLNEESTSSSLEPVKVN